MNRTLKNIFTIIFMGSSLMSCDLTLLPEDAQTTQQYWNTKEEVQAVLGSGYYYLRSSIEQMFMWGEARGNGISIMNTSDSYSAAGLKLRQMDILPSNALTDWSSMYKVVNMANSVIKYAPSVVQKDASFNTSVMNSYLSEAYFQRSLAYFYLVRTFKDVPFVTEPYVTDANPYKLAQSSGDSILNVCLGDLSKSIESAKEYFPETDATNPINTKGRATRWAILSLMADINLWLGNYSRVVSECDSVINSGKVGLINGSLWFSNFFPGNSNESIFELQYSYDLGQTNSLLSWFYNGTSTLYVPSNYSIGLYSSESAEDLRGANATYYNGMFWKYAGRDQMGTTRLSTENDQNFIVYRLAEIYLMKAEAEIMMSQPDKAADDINMTRTRAGLSQISGSSSQSSMLTMLLQERQKEFCGEAKNWFDLLRIAHRDNFTTYKSMITDQIVLWSGSANNEALIRSKLNNGDAWYLPINATELQRNNLLKQNKAYENL